MLISTLLVWRHIESINNTSRNCGVGLRNIKSVFNLRRFHLARITNQNRKVCVKLSFCIRRPCNRRGAGRRWPVENSLIHSFAHSFSLIHSAHILGCKTKTHCVLCFSNVCSWGLDRDCTRYERRVFLADSLSCASGTSGVICIFDPSRSSVCCFTCRWVVSYGTLVLFLRNPCFSITCTFQSVYSLSFGC